MYKNLFILMGIFFSTISCSINPNTSPVTTSKVQFGKDFVGKLFFSGYHIDPYENTTEGIPDTTYGPGKGSSSYFFSISELGNIWDGTATKDDINDSNFKVSPLGINGLIPLFFFQDKNGKKIGKIVDETTIILYMGWATTNYYSLEFQRNEKPFVFKLISEDNTTKLYRTWNAIDNIDAPVPKFTTNNSTGYYLFGELVTEEHIAKNPKLKEIKIISTNGIPNNKSFTAVRPTIVDGISIKYKPVIDGPK